LEPRIGVDIAFGRVGQPRAARAGVAGAEAGGGDRPAGAARPLGGIAYARDHVLDRQDRRDLHFRQHGGEVAGDEGDLGVRLGAGWSVLRAAWARRASAASVPRSAASTRSGRAAKLASPSSATNTAPPISAAPQRPVRIVPENHWTETRRRSTRPEVAPSTSNGGSSPSSIGSDAARRRFGSRRLP